MNFKVAVRFAVQVDTPPDARGCSRVASAGPCAQRCAMVALITSSSMYVENPVTTRMHYPFANSSSDGSSGHRSSDASATASASASSLAYVTVFDTVAPSGGWVEADSSWVSGPGASRGEHYGFGMSFSLGGRYWSKGVDVALPGGCRTPLGLIDEGDGTGGDRDNTEGTSAAAAGTGDRLYTLFFTRRFADCSKQKDGLPPGSRGDAANDPTMCAPLYAARFRVASWRPWEAGE